MAYGLWLTAYGLRLTAWGSHNPSEGCRVVWGVSMLFWGAGWGQRRIVYFSHSTWSLFCFLDCGSFTLLEKTGRMQCTIVPTRKEMPEFTIKSPNSQNVGLLVRNGRTKQSPVATVLPQVHVKTEHAEDEKKGKPSMIVFSLLLYCCRLRLQLH